MKQALKNLYFVNTRPLFEGQHRKLAQSIEAMGGHSHALPLQAIEPLPSSTWLQQLMSLENYAACIFVSSPAVRFFFQNLSQAWPQKLIAIAVGSATANSLNQFGVEQIITAPDANSESLIAATKKLNLEPKPILWVKGDHGRKLIGEALNPVMKVQELNIYTSLDINYTTDQLDFLWQAPSPDIILISSFKALKCLWHQIPQSKQEKFQQIPLLVFSARIAEAAKIFLKNPIFITNHDTIISSLISFNQQKR